MSFSNTRSFRFGGVEGTVAILRDGSCLEVRRGSITWKRAFKAAHPEIQQQRWSSLTSWYATLPIEMAPVEEWHIKSGWNGPAVDDTITTVYGLSAHLAYFMRRNTATAAQIAEAFRSYAAFMKAKGAPHWPWDIVFWDFYGIQPFQLDKTDQVIDVLMEGAHLFEGAGATGPEWPSITAFNLSGRRPILSYAEGDLEFSPQMMYFMGGWPSGTWADIQHVYEAYVGQKIAATHPRVEEGFIVTDTFLRHLLQTKERMLPWSAFRRLLIGRGLVWHSELPALIVEPVEVERPAERRLSFGSAPMEIDEEGGAEALPTDAEEGDAEEWGAYEAAPKNEENAPAKEEPPVPVAPSEADVNTFMARVASQLFAPAPQKSVVLEEAQADPFAELDDLWFKVQEDCELTTDMGYQVALIQEFVAICLHDDYAAAWRMNTFKRIQMRAALRWWAAEYCPTPAIDRFLKTYPA